MNVIVLLRWEICWRWTTARGAAAGARDLLAANSFPRGRISTLCIPIFNRGKPRIALQ